MLLSNERLKQIFSILAEDKKKMFFMIILTFIISFLDILGIGLIGQFIGLILNLDKLEGLNLSFNFYDYLKRFDRDKVIILSSVGLFFIFLFKNIISVFIRWVIIKFTFEKKIFLQKKLLDYYLSLKLVDFTSKNTSELTETVYELSQTFVTALESFLRILSEAIMLIMIIIFLSIMG